MAERQKRKEINRHAMHQVPAGQKLRSGYYMFDSRAVYVRGEDSTESTRLLAARDLKELIILWRLWKLIQESRMEDHKWIYLSPWI